MSGAEVAPRGALDRLLDAWFGPVDPIRMRVFETAFTASFLLYLSYPLLIDPAEWLTVDGFHVTAQTISRNYPPPAPLVPAEHLTSAVAVIVGIPVLYLLGIWRRLTGWLMFGLSCFVMAVDQPMSFTINKLYVVGYFFLAIQPWPKAGDASGRVSGWCLRILQVSLLLQYMGAGTCKAFQGDWLSTPMVLWTQSQGPFRTELAAWCLHNLPDPVWWFMAYSALAFEGFAPVLIGWKRTRTLALLYGLGFHFSITVLMEGLLYFSAQMVSLYVLFVNAERLRRWLGRWPLLGRLLAGEKVARA